MKHYERLVHLQKKGGLRWWRVAFSLFPSLILNSLIALVINIVTFVILAMIWFTEFLYDSFYLLRGRTEWTIEDVVLTPDVLGLGFSKFLHPFTPFTSTPWSLTNWRKWIWMHWKRFWSESWSVDFGCFLSIAMHWLRNVQLIVNTVLTTFRSQPLLNMNFKDSTLILNIPRILLVLEEKGLWISLNWYQRRGKLVFNFFQIWSSLYLGQQIRLGSKTMKCQLCERKSAKWATISYRCTLYLYWKKALVMGKTFHILMIIGK